MLLSLSLLCLWLSFDFLLRCKFLVKKESRKRFESLSHRRLLEIVSFLLFFKKLV
jgi:hypothetical protein